MKALDISLALHAGMPAFPGDPVFESVRVRSLETGAPYNLSELRLGSHAGTHVDPPLHFFPGGTPIDRIDLDVLNGPCVVVKVPDECRRIEPDDLSAIPPRSTRVLFRTRNSDRWASGEGFFPDYVALAVEAADDLLRRGVRLVGIDSLSIESDSTGTFAVHHALLGGGALILEGLALAEAPPGEYGLRCLPLKIAGGDGGPARATLIAP